MDPTLPNLGSIAGVIGLTIFLVAALKPAFAKAPVLAAIPTWIWTALIAAGLTAIANWLGFLPGEMKQLIYLAVMNALAAAGFRNIAQNVGTSTATSAAPKTTDLGPDFIRFGLLIALSLIGLFSGGCSTSPAFQWGASVGGPIIAQRATDYAGQDPQQLGQAARLNAATMDRSTITFPEVEASWTDVRPWFIDDSEADPVLLADINQLYARRRLINAFDSLLAEERRRRSVVGFLSPAEVPRPPSTMPVDPPRR